MRSRCLSLTVLLLGSALVLAQQPGAPVQQAPPQTPFDPKLDAILINWEKAMSNLSSLHTSVTQTIVDKVLATTTVFSGEAKYIKPNKASLWMVNQDPKKTQEFERLVCNGQIAYKWEPSLKEIHIHELPKAKPGQVSDDNFVSMLFGMKAAEAKRRYDLALIEKMANDKFYYYIEVLPRFPEDKAEFTKARLVLTTSTHLPRQIHFEQPNGNTTQWDFPKMATNIQINPAEFNQPTPPTKEWTIKRVGPQGGPRVIRPQQEQK